MICHLPSEDPYLSECCGRDLSATVQNYSVHGKKPVPCAVIAASKQFQINRLIETWKGEINDISGHLGNSNWCQYEEVKCTLNCLRTIRQHHADHMKDRCSCHKVNCQHCHNTGEDQFIKGKHKNECLKLLLSCPNKCSEVVLIQ